MLGAVLGIGAFVAILGLSDTANGQINKQFNLLEATQVTVIDAATAAGSRPAYHFPPEADQRMDHLNGVTAAGVWWQVGFQGPDVATLSSVRSDRAAAVNVYAATPGAIAAAGTTLQLGVMFNAFHDGTHQQVAVVGAAVAQQLHLSTVANQPAIFIDGTPFTVIGTVASSSRLPQWGLGVIVPAATARYLWGDPQPANAAQMLVTTRVGAAPLITRQAPVALRPDQPALLSAITTQSPTSLRHAVSANLNSLFLLLAALAVVVGALGIANTTLVSILERTSEIGLRRSLGARPIHITAQFLAESTVLGLLGGLVGTSLAVMGTLAVTVAQHWTAILQPASIVAAPAAGAAIGLLAGLYPALKAAHIEPAAALRR